MSHASTTIHFRGSQSVFDLLESSVSKSDGRIAHCSNWSDLGNTVKHFDLARFETALKTKKFGREMLYADTTPSTQTLLNAVTPKLPDGVVFCASQQTAGRGRGENEWDSRHGCLMASLVLSVSSAQRLPFIQYLVSLAILESVKKRAPNIDLKLKWPNDLYTDSVKLGGVICRSHSVGNGSFKICVGVGFNVLNSEPTTCLNDIAKEGLDVLNSDNTPTFCREEVLANFLNLLEKYMDEFALHGFSVFEWRYLQNWLHSDQQISITSPHDDQRRLKVTLKGLTATGYLRAEDAFGNSFELHPDGNSFDMFRGLISKKQLRAAKPDRMEELE